MRQKLDKICPEKRVICTTRDKPWMTTHIKTVIRNRKREFEKNGKSAKWRALLKRSKETITNAKQSYVDKILEKLKTSNKGAWYSTMKKLGTTSGDVQNGTFEILKHTDKDDKLVCEEIADYFSAISQEYNPINRNSFPAHWNEPSYPNNAPILEEHEAYKLIKEAKTTKSSVPGDLPQKINNEFAVELAVPLTIIFNAAIQESTFPTSYKKEYQVPISKVPVPKDYDELRNLSCTMFSAKG